MSTLTISTHAAYQLGFAHGSTPTAPFEPAKGWSWDQRRAYTRGFDDGVDNLIDTNTHIEIEDLRALR